MTETQEPDWETHQTIVQKEAGLLWLALQNPAAYMSGAQTIALHDAVRDVKAEVFPSLALHYISSATRPPKQGSGLLGIALASASNHRYKVQSADALYALTTASAAPDLDGSGPALVMASALARRTTLTPDVTRVARDLMDQVKKRRNLRAGDRSKIMRNLADITPMPEPQQELDLSAILPCDGWSAAVLSAVSDGNWQAQSVNLMLHQLSRAPGHKPTGTWIARCKQLLASQYSVRFLRLLIEATAFAAPADRPHPHLPDRLPVLIDPRNADVLRAACWATLAVGEPWVVPALEAAALRTIHISEHGSYESEKVPNACIYSLGAITTSNAFSALMHLQMSTNNAGFAKRIEIALDRHISDYHNSSE